ncbi:hypothetical protein F5Y13DRAFT_186284 [Hypoxylon sp. FL1857]|nr:hypothetical protein F5Y13DRAFT_186284 [Hypoxylon sp. FL1857]
MEQVDLTETRGPLLYRLGIVMAILPTLAIALRFWSRIITTSKKKVWWDDWLALGAWGCCICNCAFTIRGVQLGLGKHFEAYTSKADVTELLKLLYVSQIVFDVGITFAKSSVLLFYYRVLRSRSHNFKIAHGITLGLVIVFILFRLPAQICACVPPKKYWHPEIDGTCENDYTNFGLLLAGLLLDVITDLMILLLPMPIIWNLQLNRKKMLGLVGAFATGYITWVTSLGRLASYIMTKPHLGDPDISWYSITELAWSLSEIAVSVLSICIPSWLYLLKRLSRGGVASLFSTSDVSLTPGKVIRGGSPSQTAVGYRLPSANGSLVQPKWRDENGSITEAPLIPLVNIRNTNKIEADPTATTEARGEPGKIQVTSDVILSYKDGSQDSKATLDPHKMV